MPSTPGTSYGTLVEQIALDGQKNPDRRLAVARAVNDSDGSLILTPVGRRDDDGEVFHFASYAKAAPTYAAQMTQPFRVNTPEGVHEGKIGDYLAIGVHGEMYPIDQSVMDESYAPWNRPVEDEPLRLKVEGDGSISEVGPGGPLDHVIDTGPKVEVIQPDPNATPEEQGLTPGGEQPKEATE